MATRLRADQHSGRHKPSVFLGGLADRLAEITGEPVMREAIGNTEALNGVIQDQLEAIASKGQNVLVVLDGLDEAQQGSFDASVIPTRLPGTLRILLSARWQVGDIDSSGWLRRLGWDRNIRAEKFELGRLTNEDIADVLSKLGAPTDVLARQRNIVKRLSELTEGEPLLVRLYAEDLWQLGPQSVCVTIGDLDDMTPGFGSYFDHWLNDRQQQLWKEEGVPTEEVDRVLSILAFALGPLESRDLLGLMKELHQADNLLSEHTLLQPLRRFVIGNGRADSGYVLSHPKISDYLQNERFGGSAMALRRGFTTWGQKQLRSLNAGDLAPKNASPYASQFLMAHFEDAGLSAPERMEIVENGWRCAWEQFEGVPRGFASDVQAVWDVVRREPSDGNAIGAQWRCALVLSSIRSIGINTPDALLCAAVAHGRLSLRQAVHFVEIGRAGFEAVSLLLQLSRISGLRPSQSTDLIRAALEKSHACRDERSRARVLGALAPHLPPEQIAEALVAAKALPAGIDIAVLSMPQHGYATLPLLFSGLQMRGLCADEPGERDRHADQRDRLDVFIWSRLTCPTLVRRHAAPWSRKISATSRAERDMAAAC